MSKKYERMDLGEGYYLYYREASNGFGGYHKVNLMLYCGDEVFIKEITDNLGNFLDFPGVESGKWTDQLTGEFYTCIRYQSYISRFNRGISCFSWMVQPDGRYWEDDDGFGAESDQEIWLYALMDQDGKFVTKFSEQKPEEGEYERYGKFAENGS